MGRTIQSIVECNSLYGMASLAIGFIGIIILTIIAYKALICILNCLYKVVCKICNTFSKYKDIDTKTCVDKVSIETKLHR
jgi:hypothetical protein